MPPAKGAAGFPDGPSAPGPCHITKDHSTQPGLLFWRSQTHTHCPQTAGSPAGPAEPLPSTSLSLGTSQLES